MKRFARMLFAGLGIVIAGTAMSLVPHKAATAGGSAPVTVTNPSLPVTQSGPWNVDINGTPSVNANITNQSPLPVTGTLSVGNFPNTQNVNVANSPTVQVGNSPSNPVLMRVMDDPGRIPYVSQAFKVCTGPLFCFLPFPAVPAGHRVVIQHVSGNLIVSSGATGTITAFMGNAAINQIQFTVPIPPPNPPLSGNNVVFDQPVLYYVDGGQSLTVSLFPDPLFNTGNGTQSLTVVGYELDCNAAPCSAIATQ